MKKYLLLFICFVLFLFGYFTYNNMNINDIGLIVLSWVKKLKGDAVNINEINKIHTQPMNHDNWSALLNKHVTDKGNVNYKGFISDQTLFQNYLDNLSTHLPGNNWSNEENLSYWINAYNAFTVKLIVDNYPLSSIKNISDGLPMVNSPWDIKFFKIGNIDYDLNTIEHEILRKLFKEPRIHFAINCASVSCPKLRNEAYTTEDIYKQLDDQALSFINDKDRNVINGNDTQLSKIFDWFQSDFTKELPIVEFIRKYNASINTKNKIKFLEYNWNLNE